MVIGLEVFKAHFKDHMDKFIMIGGTACDIALSQMGLDFRVTKDLDIVLIIEALDAGFCDCFWEFVKKGGYTIQQKSSGKPVFYRFHEPDNEEYPYMLELFSRKSDALTIPADCRLTPIPTDEDRSSLSAILLDDDYYAFVLSGKTSIEGLQLMPSEYLIPLKAKAYLDLSVRKEAGESVDSRDIRKHKNDVFRLSQVLTPESSIELPAAIARDLRQFLDRMTQDPPDLKNLGIKTTPLDEIVSRLRETYNLS
jgi:hypothetical protein